MRIARNGKCELVDLGSSNGTRVNGERIMRHALASGDRIEIGSTLLIFTGTGPPSALDAAHGVDIVARSREDNDASRIVSSLSQSGTRHFRPGKETSNDADRSLEVMYLTALAVGRTDDLDEVLDRILNLVFDWVEADRGCVMLQDPQTDRLQPAARCDREGSDNAQTAEGRRMEISRTILDYVMQHKEGVRTSDARDDSRFEAAASIVRAGVREALCVPLQGRYGIVGTLYIDTYTPPGQLVATGNQLRFNDDHLRLITAIGHQAALAIEDTFYYSALVQSERLAAMGQTIATLSHHVKNILQGIRGGSYLIEAGLDREDTDAVRRGWAIVDRNQDRISNLVMDMLTFSKEREPEKVEADLNDTVTDVIELMQSRAKERDVILAAKLEEGMPDALFDPEAMHRAILNLVTNAIDAASRMMQQDDEFEPETEEAADRQPAKVFVRTSFDAEAGWIIDVMDNGPGVPPEDREKIFSLFESRKGSRGTGLGLPVSAKIMHEHGGTVEILNTTNEQGACFRLILPASTTNHGDPQTGETMV